MGKTALQGRLEDIQEYLQMDDPESLGDLAEKFGELAVFLHELGQDPSAVQCRQAAVQLGGMDPHEYQDFKVQLGQQVLAIGETLELTLKKASPNDDDRGKEVSEEPKNVILADEAIMNEFLVRQVDTLLDIEDELLNMEENPNDEDLEDLKRVFHTLKGESGLLGFTDVAELCHATEDMIQRESIIDCIDRMLMVKDWLQARFKQESEDAEAPVPVAEVIAALTVTPSETVDKSVPDTPPILVEVENYTTKNLLEGDAELVGDFIQEAYEHLSASEAHLLTLESNPNETEALNAVFRAFHTIKGLAGFIELDHVKIMAHKAENLLDMVRKGELKLEGGIMDLVFDSVDMMKRLVDGVTEALGSDGYLVVVDDLPLLMGRLMAITDGEALAVEAVASTEESAVVAKSEPPAKPKSRGFIPLGKMKKMQPTKEAAQAVAKMQPAAKMESVPVKPAPPTPTAKSAPKAPKTDVKRAPIKMKEAVRVDAERLDILIETIGELVIAESMVSQSPELQGNLSVKLAKEMDHLDKICRELQEIGMSLRMVPIKPVFQKMARLVRDVSKKQGRKVDFVMSGEDTELDKNVVDRIGDPLVHMVRNAVDHGIEPNPATRVAAGKPEHGRVELRAYHKGGSICIEIEDDGRGLNKEAILAKAVSKGLIREGENISDRDIYNLIFEPGFSTAQKVTEISGRGVGMDVVRRGIEELRGNVEITSSPGKGSTFCIKLPLTLAIIEGMVIVVGGEHYIIPTLSVVRLVRPRPQDISHVFDKGEMLAFEGTHLPLFRLHGLFDVKDAKSHPEDAVVVVVEEEGRKVALLADELIGQQSIVIKTLGEMVQGTEGVAGGAIMSDGSVALIVDVAGLVRLAGSVDTTISFTEENPVDTAETKNIAAEPAVVAAQVDNLEPVLAPAEL